MYVLTIFSLFSDIRPLRSINFLLIIEAQFLEIPFFSGLSVISIRSYKGPVFLEESSFNRSMNRSGHSDVSLDFDISSNPEVYKYARESITVMSAIPSLIFPQRILVIYLASTGVESWSISAISLILSLIIGLVTALLRLSHSFVAKTIARVYLELVRNTPLLIQLFFIYFVLGPVLGLSRFPSAVLALSLFEGAYASEIFRAGIVSIRRGQWEAAYSLGLSMFDTYKDIVLPQAIRRILPPLTSQAISLIKDSALVSTIAIYDLTMQAQAVIAETFLTFELWFTVAGMYLIVTATLSIIVNIMENRFKVVT